LKFFSFYTVFLLNLKNSFSIITSLGCIKFIRKLSENLRIFINFSRVKI
jgi:hypothetical protein